MTPLEKLQAATEAREEMVQAGLGNSTESTLLGKYISGYSDLASGVPGAAEWVEEDEWKLWDDIMEALSSVSKEAALRVVRTMPGNRAVALFWAADECWPGITKKEALRLIKDAPGDKAKALYWAAEDGWPGITKQGALKLIKKAPSDRAVALFWAAEDGWPGITKQGALKLIKKAPSDRAVALFFAADRGWPGAKKSLAELKKRRKTHDPTGKAPGCHGSHGRDGPGRSGKLPSE